MILVIDNYDSFTYNLVQYLGELGYSVEVRRNDAITLDQIEALKPDQIVISPGPGTPADAGISVELARRFHRDIPILGVCLGHQAIGQAPIATGLVRFVHRDVHGAPDVGRRAVVRVRGSEVRDADFLQALGCRVLASGSGVLRGVIPRVLVWRRRANGRRPYEDRRGAQAA